MLRSALRLTAATTISVLAGTWFQAGPSGQTQTPTFRSSTNLVTVDAYPRRGGRLVEGLTAADFDVREDGVLQKVDQFEFVRVEPSPETARVDPNNQRDMLAQAADPHNRVFVAYLDVHHVTLTGSHQIRQPLVEMLNRIVAPNDLFGVTTSRVKPSTLVLGRRMLSVEEQLTRHWPWGERNRLETDPADDVETYIGSCFDLAEPRRDKRPQAYDDGVLRPISDILRDRRREERTLQNIADLVNHLGTLREARSLVVLVTDGWRLFKPDPTLAEAAVKALDLRDQGTTLAPAPPVGAGPGGRITVGTGLDKYTSDTACRSELGRLALVDHPTVLHELVKLANIKNVVFYPVNPAGIETLDANVAETPIPIVKDMARRQQRIESVVTLANATDGIAIVGTNDLRAGLSRIVNDVSAYYLLGYYSTNPKPDGKLRQINVKVKQDEVDVVARRGYVASLPVAARTLEAGASTPIDVTESMGTLARIGTSELFTYGIVSGKDLVVVAEISSGEVELGKWRDGGTAKMVVNDASGAEVGSATGRIEAGARGVLMRLPYGNSAGPWKVSVTLSGADGSLDERLDVRVGSHRLLADPILYRSAGVARGAVLRPVADFLYRRTERVHVEWPILKPLERRTARLLDRRGQPIPVSAALTERTDAGQEVLVADLNLAQLSPGDYVLEVSAASGTENQKRQVGLRVVR